MASLRVILSLTSAIGVAGLVAGCGRTGGPFSSAPEAPSLSAPTTPVQSRPLAGTPSAAAGSQIGSGPTKVGLVLPLTQGGGAPSGVGAALRNAAELAYAESGSSDVTILVEDDRSTPDGARDATQAALGAGAEIILGPLFAADVREASRVARAAGKPVIGFSTDTSAAQHGTYLLSFLVESYVDRIVDYAAQQGKKSFAALVPESDYGNVALAAFQAAAARHDVRVQAIERYQPATVGAAAARIAGNLTQVDALFIPDQADAMPAVSAALSANGIDSHKVQILGTGVWNDPRVLKLAALQGAWFASPENGGFTAFANRYRAKFGSEPPRIATLSYDAVSLVAALARTQGAQRFSEATLTNTSGFNGADGVFRFKPEGPNDRGLAVVQVSGGSMTTLNAAPRTFGNS